MSDQAIQLMHGDCLEMMPLIPDGAADMILTDLPYGVTGCKWDVVIPFEPLWEAYKRIIKPKGAIVLTAQSPFDKVLACSNIEWLRYEWIWRKQKPTNFFKARFMPLRSHETILVFSSGQTPYNPQGTKAVSIKTGRNRKKSGSVYQLRKSNKADYVQTVGNFPRSVLDFDTDTSNPHPTAKPVPLLEYLIRTYTNEGETVLDSCMGSGSTAIACMITGRKFIGIEKDADFFEMACQRVKDEQAQGRLFTV